VPGLGEGHATSPKRDPPDIDCRACAVNHRRFKPPAQGRIGAAPLPTWALRQGVEPDRERRRVADEKQLALLAGDTLNAFQAKFGFREPLPT
jgi:hypothetical protein